MNYFNIFINGVVFIEINYFGFFYISRKIIVFKIKAINTTCECN